jgi:glycosyltransferase involved in cell wall biosynthesis
MAMSRKAIKKIGLFDEIFGRGYGEENDWCLRAAKHGFKNVILPNLFCFHNHNTSFTKSEKEELVEKNLKIVYKKYPHYRDEVRGVLENYKYEAIRNFIILLLSVKKSTKTVMRFEHTLGGGSEFALNDYLKQNYDNLSIIVRFIRKERVYKVEFFFKNYSGNYYTKDVEMIYNLFHYIKIDQIIVNQLVGYYFLEEVLAGMIEIKKQFNPLVTINVRDFFCLCHSFALIDFNSKFCEGGDDFHCLECFSVIVNDNSYSRKYTLLEWRSMWSNFFKYADEITFFSEYTKNTFLKIFKTGIETNKIKRDSIQLDYLRKIEIPVKKKNSIIEIAVIGTINFHKGAKLLNDIAELLRSNDNKDVVINIFGDIVEEYRHPLIRMKGRYKREDLPEIMENEKMDIVFIPSIWGETFCRTAEEAMLMDMPVAVFNIGAPPERVKNYKKGLIIDEIRPDLALKMIVEFVCKLRE